MDKPITRELIRWSEYSGVASRDTLRNRALAAIAVTRWVPAAGENRITGMVESRPDWVISRQRAWGVPNTICVREKGGGDVEILNDARVNARIAEAFEREGADAWYQPGARERFLGERANEDWQKVDDILDVWFDSGSTHAFVLEDPAHSLPLRESTASRTAGPTPACISKGRTNTGAGSSLRCSNPAALALAPPSTWCSRTASCSTRTGARCRNRSAT